VKRQHLKGIQPEQENGNATKSSAYSVKLAISFNWNYVKHRQTWIGASFLLYLSPEASWCAMMF